MRWMCLVMLAACGGGSGGTDASGDVGAQRCDPSAPFQAPVPVEGLNSANDEIGVRLSPDELSATFARRTGAGTGEFHLYEAKRAARNLPFDAPALLATLNSVRSEMWPSTSPSELLIAFDSDRATGAFHIYTSTRTSVGAAFGPPTSAPALADNDSEPYLANARALYFTSATRAGGQGMHDLFRSEIDSTGATSAPAAVLGVNTAADEVAPTLTPDELHIFFGRTTGAEPDIYTATRSATTDSFGTATPVSGLSSPGVAEAPNWVSPDGCSLYVQIANGTGGMGGEDVFVARRGQP